MSELGLSGCTRCGAFFCMYPCTRQIAATAGKVVKTEPEMIKAQVLRNILKFAAAWPRCGALAYEWCDGGF